MSKTAEPSFIIRKLELKDCEEVRNIWTQVNFVVSKYGNEVMMKVDPEGIYVAQDLKTGKFYSLKL